MRDGGMRDEGGRRKEEEVIYVWGFGWDVITSRWRQSSGPPSSGERHSLNHWGEIIITTTTLFLLH